MAECLICGAETPGLLCPTCTKRAEEDHESEPDTGSATPPGQSAPRVN